MFQPLIQFFLSISPIESYFLKHVAFRTFWNTIQKVIWPRLALTWPLIIPLFLSGQNNTANKMQISSEETQYLLLSIQRFPAQRNKLWDQTSEQGVQKTPETRSNRESNNPSDCFHVCDLFTGLVRGSNYPSLTENKCACFRPHLCA